MFYNMFGIDPIHRTYLNRFTLQHACSNFLQALGDKMFYNMYGTDNTEDAREKFLGTDYKDVFYNSQPDQRVRVVTCVCVLRVACLCVCVSV